MEGTHNTQWPHTSHAPKHAPKAHTGIAQARTREKPLHRHGRCTLLWGSKRCYVDGSRQVPCPIFRHHGVMVRCHGSWHRPANAAVLSLNVPSLRSLSDSFLVLRASAPQCTALPPPLLFWPSSLVSARINAIEGGYKRAQGAAASTYPSDVCVCHMPYATHDHRGARGEGRGARGHPRLRTREQRSRGHTQSQAAA